MKRDLAFTFAQSGERLVRKKKKAFFALFRTHSDGIGPSHQSPGFTEGSAAFCSVPHVDPKRPIFFLQG
jgi:hypothetical protein